MDVSSCIFFVLFMFLSYFWIYLYYCKQVYNSNEIYSDFIFSLCSFYNFLANSVTVPSKLMAEASETAQSFLTFLTLQILALFLICLAFELYFKVFNVC